MHALAGNILSYVSFAPGATRPCDPLSEDSLLCTKSMLLTLFRYEVNAETESVALTFPLLRGQLWKLPCAQPRRDRA